MTPRPAGSAVSVAASIGALGATLLPWLRTGRATRSAFGLARSAEVLGLFDGASRRVCLALWYLLPFLVASTWTAWALRRHALAATLGTVVGMTSVTAGIVVIALAGAEAGPIAAAATGAVAIGGGLWFGLEGLLRGTDNRLKTITEGATR